MHSNNILNFQESMTILNACTKKSGNLLNAPCIYISLCLCVPSSSGFIGHSLYLCTACFPVITLFTQVHPAHKILNWWVCQRSICNTATKWILANWRHTLEIFLFSKNFKKLGKWLKLNLISLVNLSITFPLNRIEKIFFTKLFYTSTQILYSTIFFLRNFWNIHPVDLPKS